MAEFKVYVNYSTQDCFSEKEFLEYIKECVKDGIDLERNFEMFLNDNYYMAEIFKMSDAEKKEVYQNWKDYVRADVEEEMRDSFEEYSFPIECISLADII
jgi:hypothetical protein